MCGRFWIPKLLVDNALRGIPQPLHDSARQAIADWIRYMNRPRYDVRPTDLYPAITSVEAAPMRWGFKTSKSNAVFNARCESLKYEIWRESLILRRALVVVGGFYEWTGPKSERQAHAVHRPDNEPMLLAALWKPDPQVGPSFSIITTPATEWMAPLHDRMPLILEAEQAGIWLDLTRNPGQIMELVHPYAGALAEFPCAPPKNDLEPRPLRELF